jgi:hypothetical protein
MKPAISRDIGLTSGAEIMTLLQAIYPRFHILDTTFPMMTFAWLHDDVAALLDTNDSPGTPEQEFYSRFRQAGGHLPLLTGADLATHASSASAQPFGANRTVVVACHAAVCASLLEYLTGLPESAVILIGGDQRDLVLEGDLAQLGFAPQVSIRFVRPAAAETWCLFSRVPCDAMAIGNIVTAAKTFAVDVSMTPPSAGQSSYGFRIVLPETGFRPPSAHIAPERFIHDGSRPSETSDGYAWLWVGAERHIRLLLGRIPCHFAKLRVLVPKAFTTDNLRSATLLLNGEIVPSHIEVWEEGAGAISADLPSDRESETVLGLFVMKAQALGAGESALSACIDKIEFSA